MLVSSIFFFSHYVFQSLFLYGVEPITRRQILDSSKLKAFADDNLKFDENGRKLSKRVDNTVGKGEIACYEQFLLFPQCFQKACFPRQKVLLCRNGLKLGLCGKELEGLIAAKES